MVPGRSGRGLVPHAKPGHPLAGLPLAIPVDVDLATFTIAGQQDA
jgi:hypothetical protein